MLTVQERQTFRLGRADVGLYHLLPYMTILTTSKAAVIAFVMVAISAPTTGRGGIAVVSSCAGTLASHDSDTLL